MNTGIEGRRVGKIALEYIRKCLGDGRTLSQKLLHKANLDSGYVVALLPEALSEEDVEDFQHGKLPQLPPSEWRQWGHLTLKPVPNTNGDLAGIIVNFLKHSEGVPVCLIENEIANRGEPFLAQRLSKIVYLGSEVYHVLTSSAATEGDVLQAIRESCFVPISVGCLAVLDPGSSFEPETGGDVSEEDIDRIADRTEKIFVGAYDGESYLIWSRTET